MLLVNMDDAVSDGFGGRTQDPVAAAVVGEEIGGRTGGQ
jgi:hypothetical protein